MNENITNQVNELTSLVTSLKTLQETNGWKYISTILEEVLDSIHRTIMTTMTDQALKFNADHLLKERYAVINMILELPNMKIKDIEKRITTLKDNSKPIEIRLQEQNKNLEEELKAR